MYRKILVALENGRADEALLPHIAQLAQLHGAELFLVHVADGFAARHFEELKLAESDEMKRDRAYLEEAAAPLRQTGLAVNTALQLGDPATELVKAAEEQECDLIAMASHGHRLIGDILHGSTINEVRHRTTLPVLLIRAGK